MTGMRPECWSTWFNGSLDRLFLILTANHSDHVVERFLNVPAIPRRSLNKFAS